MPAAAITPAFDRVAHAYSLNGRPLVSVTQAIREAGLMDERWFTEEVAQRGSFVHQAIDLLDRGQLDESSIDYRLAGYIDAYRKFRVECHAGPLHLSEVPVCDPLRGYAGTIDRVRHVGQQLAVLDVKTGPPADWHPIQLAAYAELAKTLVNYPLLRRWGLYLRADGSYTLKPYLDRSDWDVFCACLTVAQWKRRHA